MRTALVVIAVSVASACGSPATPASERLYITIGNDAVAAAKSVAEHDGSSVQIVDTKAGATVLSVDAGELEALSATMHEDFQRCGGFMVHDSLDDAEAALATAASGPTDKRPVDYTIDRPDEVKAVVAELDRSRILATIGELQAMKNRYYRSDEGAAASQWLADRWRSFMTRSDVTIELFDQGYPQKSVILTIPGTTKASEVVVIGGHLDSIARGGVNAIAPGADDDASGIATITEVLRVLLAKDIRPARTIKFMAYAAEEIGLRGSQAIARDYAKRGINVIGALQLDMTNYKGSEKDIYLMKDFTNAAQNVFVSELIDRYVGATWGMDACGYACSDHASWYRTGVPASMPFEATMRTANRSIHTDADTLERSNNNADHAIKFAKLGAAYAVELAKADLGNSRATLTTAPEAPSSSHHGKWIAIAVAALGVAMWRRSRR